MGGGLKIDGWTRTLCEFYLFSFPSVPTFSLLHPSSSKGARVSRDILQRPWCPQVLRRRGWRSLQGGNGGENLRIHELAELDLMLNLSQVFVKTPSRECMSPLLRNV